MSSLPIVLSDSTPGSGGKVTQLYPGLELFSEGEPPRHTLFVLGKAPLSVVNAEPDQLAENWVGARVVRTTVLGAVTLAVTLVQLPYNRALTADPGNSSALMNMAYIYLRLGRTDEALDRLEEAVRCRATDLIWLKVRPVYDGLHDSPRFRVLEQALGFSEGVEA